ncbi:helix-turn-helix domain-containing protein [Streptomyces xanthophaeus]|uniref:helix-turn-helix domain-containing protein n=1 Tax=Streptomyces xanthophaeus TaxID=67385 RepID=UPI00399031E8
MTRTDLAPPSVDSVLIERLAAAVESLARLAAPASDLRCYTPAQAAELLGKTENWVVEAIQDGRIPCTYIGKSPRLTADHIRWVQNNGERMPNKYSIRAA